MNFNENKHLEICINHIKDMMVWIGGDGRLLHANAPALDFYGFDLESFTQLTIHDIDTNFPREAWPQHWESLKRNKSLTVTVQHREKSGLCYTVEIVDNYQNIDGNEFSVCVIRTIDHRKDRDRRLQFMEFSVDSMLDSALWIDQEGSIIFANDATCRNLDYAHDELTTMSIYDIDSGFTNKTWPMEWERLKKNKITTFETEHRRKDGYMVPVEVNLNYLKVYEQEISCAFVRDITERKLHEQQLLHIATHDSLTGLPNRACLYDRASHAVLNAKRDNTHTAVILVDLDRFKFVNDNLGHDAGDEMLRVLSNRMACLLRESDTVARLGGDEFVILLDSIKRPDDCALVGEKLLQTILEPLIYGEELLHPGASVGIAVYPEDGGDVTSLLKSADIAMYQSKREGGNQYHFYKREMGERIARHIAIVNGLQLALKEGHFVLHYQPIFDMKTKQLVSAEALLRWQDPERGLIPPLEFIPEAEESELIVPIGSWVLEETCRQNSRWMKEGLNIVPIAVNLSARQMDTDDIVTVVKQSLKNNELPPEYISLELTESMVMNDPDTVIKIINQFQGMGVHVAIDDFGTGYSSLNYLQHFSIDAIKIDRSFVKDISGKDEDAVIANAIISLAHGLGCRVLAEGVENSTQYDYLRDRGCDLVQGFLFSKPVTAEEFERILIESMPAVG